MNILDKVVEVSKILDEIDEFDKSVPDKMAEYNYKLSDLYHYIESNTMDSKKSYRICREFKKVLIERREFNLGIDNRKMLLSTIGKKAKYLNQPYKNRIYDDEELKRIMEG